MKVREIPKMHCLSQQPISVEQDGTISYDFLEEDYKLRADPEEVLSKL